MNYEIKKTDINILDRAYWLGISPRVKEGEKTRLQVEVAYFKKTFCLSEKAPCNITVSAHSRYKLYVNGEFVTYGPCKGDIYRRYCDNVSIGEYLVEGDNTILIQVVSFPPYEAGDVAQKGPDWSMNRACGPCLMLSGSIRSSKDAIRLTTGHGDWQVYNSCELTPCVDTQAETLLGYFEQIDMKGHIDPSQDNIEGRNWEEPVKLWNVEDTEFGIIPVFELYERPIPLQTLEERYFKCFVPRLGNEKNLSIFEKSGNMLIPANTSGHIEIDAGELTTGFFRLPVDGGRGRKITVLYSEAYGVKNATGRYTKAVRDDWINTELEGYEDSFVLSGYKEMIEPFWFRTFRFISIKVETGESDIILHRPTYLETGYPLEEKTKPTDSSIPWLRDIWDMSLKTLRRCMHETYEDCPYYEQMQYTLDTRLQILFTYAVSGDRRMPLRTIYDYHASLLPNGMLQSRYPCETTQIIPPFALHWISMIEDFYWESGDKAIIRRYLPTIDAVIGYFRRHKKNGLVENLGYWEFADWALEWDKNHGVPNACEYGPSTIFNFTYAYALRLAARLMRTIEFSDIAEEYEIEASEICKTLKAVCYNEEAGIYREGPNLEEYSQHAQVWAVMAEAESMEFRKALMERVYHREDLILCTFPLQFYLFRAYEAVGLYKYTEKLWNMWKRLLPMHLTTIPEIPDNARSDCHAWGSVLLYEFPRKILGVEALKPGYESIAVRPRARYCSSASGVVHTPRGDIRVFYSWEGERFSLNVYHNCDAEVMAYLPNGDKKACPSGVETDIILAKISPASSMK